MDLGSSWSRAMPVRTVGRRGHTITYLEKEDRYAITYTGYSRDGPRVCLITTDDLLSPARYRRHGPRIAGENKNCVILPEKIDGKYVIIHRPMPRMVCVRVSSLEAEWPADGVPLVGPQPNTWRSSRVGAGAPPVRTDIGWLLPFHGATTIEEGNVYSMGWCVLDLKKPEKVLYVSDAPALTPEAPYESLTRFRRWMATSGRVCALYSARGLWSEGRFYRVYGAAPVSMRARA